MLHSYLRIRIKKVSYKCLERLNLLQKLGIYIFFKIEQFASAILEEDQSRKRNKLSSKLSPEEFAYATQ